MPVVPKVNKAVGVHQIPADSTARMPRKKAGCFAAAALLCYWLSQRKTEQADDQGAGVRMNGSV
jgi:hypothetical protein